MMPSALSPLESYFCLVAGKSTVSSSAKCAQDGELLAQGKPPVIRTRHLRAPSSILLIGAEKSIDPDNRRPL
jgi:hypothetical protein